MAETFPSFLKGTTAMWEAWSDIIPAGVPCAEIINGTDTNGNPTNFVKAKLGDGVHRWAALDYIGEDYVATLDNFSETADYITNSLVRHNSNLYVANEGVSAGLPFNPAQWTNITEPFYTKTQIDEILTNYAYKATGSVNVLKQVSINRNTGTGDLELRSKNINVNSQVESDNVAQPIPLASSTESGLMTKQSVQAISQLQTDVNAIKGRVVRYVIDFAQFNDPLAPTPAELLQAYKDIAGVSTDPSDGVTLVDKDNPDTIWIYYLFDTTWRRQSQTNATAGTGSLGLTMGTADQPGNEGKVYVEQDGSMSVLGYDAIKNRMDNSVLDINDGNHHSQLVIEQNDYDGHQTAQQVLNIKVTDSQGQEVAFNGVAINGKRTDFDYRSLILKNASDETITQLQKEYTITTPYAAIEMYGKLFIFDEKVPGRGIIRDYTSNTITEVEDLGIYAPSSTINVIHVIDPDDKDVCYVLNETTQTKTLVVYPDGSYKVADFGPACQAAGITDEVSKLNFTPQRVNSLRLMTSLDNNRHSWMMWNSHPMNSATTTMPTVYFLFQLEDASIKFLNNTVPEASGMTYVTPGAFTPFSISRAVMWEGHTDLPDPEFVSHRDTVNTAVIINSKNQRFPFKTGQWQSERGLLKDFTANGAAQFNGIYKFDKGAIILEANYTTSTQYILVTPEGFIGWFRSDPTTNGSETYEFCRTVELQSGPYKGKRALFMASINNNTYTTQMIVNTPNGDPAKTVLVSLNTNLTNKHHISGKNPIAAAYLYYTGRIYTDLNRIYCGAHSGHTNSQRYFQYINQSEIAPCTYETNNYSWKLVSGSTLDYHCIDSLIDSPNAKTDNVFTCRDFAYLRRVETVGPKGTLVFGDTVSSYQSSTMDLFMPDAPDEFDVGTNKWVVRPYFIQHEDQESIALPEGRTTPKASKYTNLMACSTEWHNHLFVGLAGSNAFMRDYYFNTTTNRIVERKLKYTAQTFTHPIVLDDKHLVIWSTANETKMNVLTWKPALNDYELIQSSGGWTPPRGMTGHMLVKQEPTPENFAMGLRTELYFFDAESSTAPTNYLKLTYTEDGAGDSVPSWQTFTLPKAMNVRSILATPVKGRILIFPTATDTLGYMITLSASGSSTTITFPESIIAEYFHDITNTNNPNESDWGAYAIFPDADVAYVYVLEWDYSLNTPALQRYPTRSKVQRRIWGLPDGFMQGKVTTRFAVGNNSSGVSTASSPFTIIERIGGTIDINNVSGSTYTQVRDFGNSGGTQAARADLATPAYIWTEPHVVPWEPTTVRFLTRKTLRQGSNYSDANISALLGYHYTDQGAPIPVYGHRINLGEASNANYSQAEDSYHDIGVIEIGLTSNRDSYISVHNSNVGTVVKLADGWEAHAQDRNWTNGTKFAGGPQATIWMHFGDDSYNFAATPMRLFNSLTIANKLISSTEVPTHIAGQYTQEFYKNSFATAPWITDTYGGALIVPTIRKHRIFFRHFGEYRLANYSVNETPLIIDMEQGFPYAAYAATDYTAVKGDQIFGSFQYAVRTPIFQLFDNQILPGIYHRRNNQDLNPYMSLVNENVYVPYFMFTDEELSHVFKSRTLGTFAGRTPFVDDRRLSKQRYEYFTGNDNKYQTRETYNTSSGDTIIMKWFVDPNTGVSKYKDLTLQGNFETIDRLISLNGFLELAGNTNHHRMDIVDETFIKSADAPDHSAILSFDLGTDIVVFRDDKKDALYNYAPNILTFDYQGDQYYAVPLRDLVIKGNNAMDDLTVINKIRAQNAKFSSVEADRIYVTSHYRNVVI